jgi:asparagine synthase (glutamine-hydrolysing)
MSTESLSDSRQVERTGLVGEWVVSLRQSRDDGVLSSSGASAADSTGPALHLESGRLESTVAWRADERAVVAFDGVLYNRLELQKQPTPSIASSESSSDADLVLQAYRRWGDDLPRKLNGIFALVIWDRANRKLLAVRDPLGIYPLFYAEVGSNLYLSPSIGALSRNPQVPDKVNRAALADHLLHRWPDLTETFFSHVRRLPPGHVIHASPSGIKVERYWDPAPPGTPIDWIPAGEAEERFEHALSQAVSRYLGFGPAGIFLSGGLDSVSIAAEARELSRRSELPVPWALSLVFPDPECNEEAIQRRVAEQLGLPQVLLPFFEAVGPKGLIESALAENDSWPTPLLNTWWPAYRQLALEGKSRGCQVILTGGGGDEWLTVSPFLAADLLRSFDVGGFVRLYRNILRSQGGSRLATFRALLWIFGLRPLAPRVVRKSMDWIVPKARGALARRNGSSTRYDRDWVAPGSDLRKIILEREKVSLARHENPQAPYYLNDLRSILEHPMMVVEIEENFEYGRRTGLRFLRPYWDADLVDLLARTPPDVLNKGGRSKGLVRESMARRFPELGFERQKKVWATNFFDTTVLRESKDAWQALGGTPVLADYGIVDPRALESTVAEIQTGRHLRSAPIIWEVMALERWLRSRT